MADEVTVERRRYSGSPINTIVSIYLLIGFLLGVYAVFVAPGAIVMTPTALFQDAISILLYMLLWPFFLFGGLHFRLS